MGGQRLEAWLGGAYHGVKSGCIAGFALIVKLDGEVIYQDSKVIGTGEAMCDSVAAYCGLIAFLQWYQSRYGIGLLKINELPGATIYSGSVLLACQMNGRWVCEKGKYVAYYNMAARLMTENYLWGLFDFLIQGNTEANRLAKEVLLSRGVPAGGE